MKVAGNLRRLNLTLFKDLKWCFLTVIEKRTLCTMESKSQRHQVFRNSSSFGCLKFPSLSHQCSLDWFPLRSASFVAKTGPVSLRGTCPMWTDIKWSTPASKFPLHVQQKRYKSKKRQSSMQNDSDSESDEDDALAPDDFDAPAKFKVMKIHTASMRTDAIISNSLDVSRNRLEEMFYGPGLLLNGNKMLKKSIKMEEGDYVDLVVDKLDDQLKVKRVKIIKIYSGKTNTDKLHVKVRVWKAPFLVDNPDNERRSS